MSPLACLGYFLFRGGRAAYTHEYLLLRTSQAGTWVCEKESKALRLAGPYWRDKDAHESARPKNSNDRSPTLQVIIDENNIIHRGSTYLEDKTIQNLARRIRTFKSEYNVIWDNCKDFIVDVKRWLFEQPRAQQTPSATSHFDIHRYALGMRNDTYRVPL